jgi:hypothetical protein
MSYIIASIPTKYRLLMIYDAEIIYSMIKSPAGGMMGRRDGGMAEFMRIIS